MKLLRLYADDSGESHWDEIDVELNPVEYAPPAPPFDVSEPASAAAYVMTRVPPGWEGGLHQSPRRMLCVVMSGEVEFTASDGDARGFVAGGTALLEDTTGKGHATRIKGDEETFVVIVQLD